MRRILAKAIGLVLVAIVIVAGIFFYNGYTQQKIFEDSFNHLLSTYDQVNSTFVMFSRANWTMLEDCDDDLRGSGRSSATKAEARLEDFEELQDEWGFSELYLCNKNNDFLAASGRSGNARSIEGVFSKAATSGEKMLSSYTATDGTHKIVFAIRMDKAMKIGGVSYTIMAVCYDDDYLEHNIIGDHASSDADCYVVDATGEIVLSLQPKTELPSNMTNFVDFLEGSVDFLRGSADTLRSDISSGSKGGMLCAYGTSRLYVVYQPTGISDWRIMAAVDSSSVDSSLYEMQYVTIALVVLVALVILALVAALFAYQSRVRLQRKDMERAVVEHERDLTGQLFSGMTAIVDRFASVDLRSDRYEYHERLESKPLYPKFGRWSAIVEQFSRDYVILTDTENAKFARMLSPEYLRQVLHRQGDILKIEYSSRLGSEYRVMSVVPIEWSANGELVKVLVVVQDIGQKKELETLANTDGLTGLFNERYFSQILHHKEEVGLPFALYYLDLDRFKPVNDQYGHDMGDKLLKEVALRLQSCIRGKDYAFRIGGDEFCVIIADELDPEQRDAMVGRIKEVVAAPYEIDGVSISVGTSCGCAVYPGDSWDVSEIRKLADARMYEDKRKRSAGR